MDRPDSDASASAQILDQPFFSTPAPVGAREVSALSGVPFDVEPPYMGEADVAAWIVFWVICAVFVSALVLLMGAVALRVRQNNALATAINDEDLVLDDEALLAA